MKAPFHWRDWVNHWPLVTNLISLLHLWVDGAKVPALYSSLLLPVLTWWLSDTQQVITTNTQETCHVGDLQGLQSVGNRMKAEHINIFHNTIPQLNTMPKVCWKSWMGVILRRNMDKYSHCYYWYRYRFGWWRVVK